jgi:hypothetical protein
LKIDPNFFLQHFKNKIILNFVKFMATKKGMTTILCVSVRRQLLWSEGLAPGLLPWQGEERKAAAVATAEFRNNSGGRNPKWRN